MIRRASLPRGPGGFTLVEVMVASTVLVFGIVTAVTTSQRGLQATEDTAGLARFTCTRAITDLKTDMKQITLTATWRGYDGQEHTARLITRYGKSGLNDYFYTTH